VANSCNLATSGTQNAGKPSFTPTEVSLLEKGRPSPTLIKAGVEGAQSHPRGFGGCAPKNLKIGGELPTLAIQPRGGPKTPANPQPARVGKTGVQGVWKMCQQEP
jgi:hypothetical protein